MQDSPSKLHRRTIRVFDSVFFMGVLALGLVVAIHGKRAASSLLYERGPLLNEAFTGWSVWVTLLGAVLGTEVLRQLRSLPVHVATVLMAGVALGVPFVFFVVIGIRSTIVFGLQTFLLAIAGLVVVISRYVNSETEMSSEFWKMLFDGMIKLIGFTIAIFGAGIAALRFISSSVGESTGGFLTTLWYPSIAMLLAFFLVGYWVMLPAWVRLEKSFVVVRKVQCSATAKSGRRCRNPTDHESGLCWTHQVKA